MFFNESLSLELVIRAQSFAGMRYIYPHTGSLQYMTLRACLLEQVTPFLDDISKLDEQGPYLSLGKDHLGYLSAVARQQCMGSCGGMN